MSAFYESGDNFGLLIYPHKNTIILRKKVESLITNPTILETDYKSDLTSVIFNSTIYFAYINTSNLLLVKCILDKVFPYQVLQKENELLSNPRLISYNGQLLLFYLSKIDTTYTLNCIRPYDHASNISLPISSFDSEPFYHIVNVSNKLCLIISSNGKNMCYYMNSSFVFDEYKDKKDAEIKKLKSTLESAKKQYNELMEIALRYKEELEEIREYLPR